MGIWYDVRMRLFLLFALVIGGTWAATRYVPVDTRHDILARIGVAHLFEETIPEYLKKKFSVREDPAKKRAKLLDELALELDSATKDIKAITPEEADGKPLPSSAEVQVRAERVNAALTRSEELLREVDQMNTSDGTFARVTARVLDAVLPISAAPPAPEVCPE